MTLMKQARAFGVAVVLATQNPVDIDYKALSNAGTWMIGQLQTDRDKARLLDGMTSAAGGADIAAVDDDLGPRQGSSCSGVRVGHAGSVHHAVRAMAYLRGPMTRDQIAACRSRPAETPTPTPDRSSSADPESAVDAAAPPTDAASRA